MPAKRRPTAAAPAPMSYAQWSKEAKALAGATTMRERDWRNLFIKGKSPSEAGEEAKAYAYNARPAATMLRGGKKRR